MTVGIARRRRTLARLLGLLGLGAGLGGCYYVVPAYPVAPAPAPGPYVPPGSVYVPARWVWNGAAWVWQPAYWLAPAPPGGPGGPPPAVGPGGPPPAPGPSGPPPPGAPPRTN